MVVALSGFQQIRHSRRERRPLFPQKLELLPPPVSELVVLARDPPRRRLPPHRDIAGALEPVEHGIERAVGHLERAIGLSGEFRDDLVAVGLARLQEMQDDELERSTLELAPDASAGLFHGHYGSAIYLVTQDI